MIWSTLLVCIPNAISPSSLIACPIVVIAACCCVEPIKAPDIEAYASSFFVRPKRIPNGTPNAGNIAVVPKDASCHMRSSIPSYCLASRSRIHSWPFIYCLASSISSEYALAAPCLAKSQRALPRRLAVPAIASFVLSLTCFITERYGTAAHCLAVCATFHCAARDNDDLATSPT